MSQFMLSWYGILFHEPCHIDTLSTTTYSWLELNGLTEFFISQQCPKLIHLSNDEVCIFLAVQHSKCSSAYDFFLTSAETLKITKHFFFCEQHLYLRAERSVQLSC